LISNPGFYIALILFIGSCIIAEILYLYKIKILAKNLQKIIYFDSKRYNPDKISALAYFGGDLNINQKETEREFQKENHSEECKKENEQEKEQEQELQLRENKMEIKNNIDNRNEIRVNNFIVTDNLEKTRAEKALNNFITLQDYESLEGEESLMFDKRTYIQMLKDRLQLDHPVISLIFKKSMLDPIFIRLICFIFQYSLQFTINAMFFTDNLIATRINNSNNVFIYLLIIVRFFL
jgi:hypothetical protein